MMEALRRSASGVVAKVLIGLLVLSFAVWGVADIFTGYRTDDVAVVGDTPVTIQEYQNQLQQEIQRVSQQAGSYLTMDQARAFGLDTRVLGRMMAQAALTDEAGTLGLGVTDAVVAESIRNDPNFQTPGGQFDRTYFDQVVRSIGYTEAGFVAAQKDDLTRQMIAEAVGGGVEPPQVLEKAIDRYRNETRSAEYIVVDASMTDSVPDPTEEDLRTYFEDNTVDFRAPEYRKVAVLSLSPAELAPKIDVSDEEIAASYEADPSRFGAPERRTIERIVFDDLAAAEQARRDIADGKSFEDVATGLGLTDDDRKLGTLTKDGILDPAIAEAAFALEVGDVSDPVQGTFGPALVRVTDIETGTNRSLDEVKDEIKIELAVEKAKTDVLDIYDAVEDDRAGGMTLSEIADKQGLSYREIEAIDRQGEAPDETPVMNLPESPDFVPEVFSTDIGVEADPLQTRGDGWAWFDVLDITEARDRTFEEARDKVETAWRAEQVRTAIEAKAKEIAETLRSGSNFFEMAEQRQTTPGLVGPLRRNQAEGPFGSAAVQLLFTTPEGDVAWTEADQAPRRVVFRVTEITVPEFQPGSAEQDNAEIVSGITNDLLGQYLQELENRIGTTVNQEALRLALGESSL